MGGWVDGCNRAKIKVWAPVHDISQCAVCGDDRGAFRSSLCRETKTHVPPPPPPPTHPLNPLRNNILPNEYRHVKLLYICVMKSIIELWEVDAFLCESEPLPSHLLYPHRTVYQKYVCCYCVHTISVTMIYNYTENPKLPLSYWQ